MKVLAISDSCNLYTGFGTQTFITMQGLKKRGLEIEQLGWFQSQHIVHAGIQIHPMGEYGDLNLVIDHCNRFKPDIIWSLGDLHMIEYMLSAPEELKKRWTHWLPIDAEPYPILMHKALEQVPNLVLMSDFALKMCKPHLPNAKMVPHGLDTNVFRPVPQARDVRVKNKVDDKFVVLMVAKNQWRKCLDLAVESFARFSKGKNDVLFLMHTQIMSVPKLRGWLLPHLWQLNAQDHDPDLISGKKIQLSGEQIHESKLNFLYNLADVFFLSSAGEGFGIPGIEAQMAGLPVVLPDFTTGREFVLPDGKEENRTGELINIAINQIQPDAGVKRALISPQDAADKLDKLYRSWKSDKALIKRYSENARRTSIQKYNFDVVINKWYDIINNLYKEVGHGTYAEQQVVETAEFDINMPLILEEI